MQPYLSGGLYQHPTVQQGEAREASSTGVLHWGRGAIRRPRCARSHQRPAPPQEALYGKEVVVADREMVESVGCADSGKAFAERLCDVYLLRSVPRQSSRVQTRRMWLSASSAIHLGTRTQTYLQPTAGPRQLEAVCRCVLTRRRLSPHHQGDNPHRPPASSSPGRHPRPCGAQCIGHERSGRMRSLVVPVWGGEAFHVSRCPWAPLPTMRAAPCRGPVPAAGHSACRRGRQRKPRPGRQCRSSSSQNPGGPTLSMTRFWPTRGDQLGRATSTRSD
jgi:hypothetical protein